MIIASWFLKWKGGYLHTRSTGHAGPSVPAHIFLAIPQSIAVALSAAIVGATAMTAAPVSPASPTLASTRGSGAAAVMVVAVLVVGAPAHLSPPPLSPIGVTVAVGLGIAFAGIGRVCIFLLRFLLILLLPGALPLLRI
ncbi:hypothetical protein DFH08DRAFT_963817 [Mycena albidolilacea]|uniref:Uncharacterized protein n=1 Tax=Mycena albidolilacea TaxID=1033008 RepID=A0AAD6ZU40_9AGAR|nr:hypothetical protein DFH08DRAFT_963817 [Mycena albidolilacea]